MFNRFTERARKVIVFAKEEARRFNHDYIGTEHLLLGLVREGEGIAMAILESFGVSQARARAETVRVFESRPRQAASPEATAPAPPVPPESAALVKEGEASLTCRVCGAQNLGYFRHCFNCGERLIETL